MVTLYGRYDCLSAQVLKEMESDPDLVLDPDVLFVANSNRYAFDQSAVRFMYEHFSTVAHDYSKTFRALQRNWARACIARWTEHVAQLSPLERLAVELSGIIKKQRAFVQKHLPSLATIRRLLEAVHAVIMRPHIIAMANAIQQMYGGAEAHDGGHWGSGGTLLTYEATTANTAGVEHDPAAVAGNLKSMKQQAIFRISGQAVHIFGVHFTAYVAGATAILY